MLKVTLDKNVLIDLEESRESAPYVRRLIELHKLKSLKIQVSKAQASEGTKNSRGSQAVDLFGDYEVWLHKIGIPSDIEQLLTPACWGFGYGGHNT